MTTNTIKKKASTFLLSFFLTSLMLGSSLSSTAPVEENSVIEAGLLDFLREIFSEITDRSDNNKPPPQKPPSEPGGSGSKYRPDPPPTASQLGSDDKIQDIQNTNSEIIDAFNVCKRVANRRSDGYNISVPHSTAEEWQSFRDNPPGNIEFSECIILANLSDSCATPRNGTCSLSWNIEDIYPGGAGVPAGKFVESIVVRARHFSGSRGNCYGRASIGFTNSGTRRAGTCGARKDACLTARYDSSAGTLSLTSSTHGWGSCGGAPCNGCISHVQVTFTLADIPPGP